MSLRVPKLWTTSFGVVDCTLVVPFTIPRVAISSAVHGGGIVQADSVINHQVALKGMDEDHLQDPSRYLGRLAKGLGLKGTCVGLMTTVDMRCLVLQRMEAKGIWIEGFFTVGVANAVRAGDSSVQRPGKMEGRQLGTINMILVTNVRLSRSAMVNAIGVATESKTATLMDECIMNSSGSRTATGTGTDVVAVVSGDGSYCRYSGTHTKVGELIGRVVRDGVKKGLQKDRVWTEKY